MHHQHQELVAAKQCAKALAVQKLVTRLLRLPILCSSLTVGFEILTSTLTVDFEIWTPTFAVKQPDICVDWGSTRTAL